MDGAGFLIKRRFGKFPLLHYFFQVALDVAGAREGFVADLQSGQFGQIIVSGLAG